MRQPRVDDRIRLTHDIPELSLSRGQIGVVRSTWLAPLLAYEVEFFPRGQMQTRALLLAEQLEVYADADAVEVEVDVADEHEADTKETLVGHYSF